MKVSRHIGLSLSVALGVYTLSRSAVMAAASFAAGVFVDADHAFEYLREYGFRPDIKFFFRSFHETLYRHIVLFLHAWEWFLLLAAVAVWSGGDSVLVGVIIGLGQHLIADQFTNPINRWGYFFSYRALHKFQTGMIFPGRGLE
jgi:membrane-bound metal-dependent hydrolase YbcI (DUF457 family)